ncbi:MAG: putative amidase [Paucimonas sp.]|nr:putative amidase [Paucimonas sp.]
MNTNLLDYSLRDLVSRIARRELRAEDVTQACIEQIEAREPEIHAWQFFDPALALAQARALDAQAAGGPLFGAPLGVKDLMDTADMPTTYGSPIYAGNRPRFDAACVAASRAAGAVILGKTVTTEFATFHPGPTRNPRGGSADYTPGGSSSGSAAAVAAGMVRVAFGTQTAGSIVRPAAYCGIVGYKPTHGTLPLAGIKPLAPSLDTVGLLARSVDDAAFVIAALARLPLGQQGQQDLAGLRVGLCQTPHWDRASQAARDALLQAARALEQAGARLADAPLPDECKQLTQAQLTIMASEAAAAFEPETQSDAARFSPAFTALVATGRGVSGAAFQQACAVAAQARQAVERLFGNFDILLAPSAEGEAPAGLAATGDPIFNRLWTLLGNPCVQVPVGTGPGGLPLGVTVVGPRWGDAQALAAAAALERALGRNQ